MGPAKAALRVVFPLLKACVVAVDSVEFRIVIGGSTTITVRPADMSLFDIRDGDLLTLYTEVLLKPPQG
jgi:hypothetical protein